MKKIGKIIALVIVGILVSVNFTVVTYLNIDDGQLEQPSIFVENKNGNPTGDFFLKKQDNGQYNLIIEAWDTDAQLSIRGISKIPNELLVKMDYYVDDPYIKYVVYVDPLDFESAIITVPKSNSVLDILHSVDFDSFQFTSDSWEKTALPFWEDENTVTFQVDHFSAYAIVEELTRYTVTNSKDSGSGSLRQAILDANSNLGTDIIDFDIPTKDENHYYYRDDKIEGQVTSRFRKTTSVNTDSFISDLDPDHPHSFFMIHLESELPVITDSVIIDGYTQTGSKENTLVNGNNAVLKIELNGAGAGWFPGGLNLKAGYSTIRGLAVMGFGLCGIQIDTKDKNVIEGNFIGTDISGTLAKGNFIGVNIFNSSNNLVGGYDPASKNIILGNKLLGVFISGTEASHNVVVGNYVTSDETDTSGMANRAKGVWIAEKVESENTISGNYDLNELNVQNFNQIIFLDPSVPNYLGLLKGLLQNQQATSSGYHSDSEIMILDIDRDGMTQITQILKEYSELTGVHIISHGDLGSINLGSGTLDIANIDYYSEQLSQWALALASDADILIYGCNVAQGDVGLNFVERIGELTKADIAASNDLTGSQDLGGDWELEVKTGKIETAIAFDSETLNNYNHILGIHTYYDITVPTYVGNPKISPHTKTAIVNGLSELAGILGDLSSSSHLSQNFMEGVPGLLDLSDPQNPVAPGFGSLIGGLSLEDQFQSKVADEISLNFTVHSTLASLETFLDNLDTTEGSLVIRVDDVSKNIVSIGGNDYEMRINMKFSIIENKTYKFDMGRNADVIGFIYDPNVMPSLKLQIGFEFDLSFGCILTLTEGDFDLHGDTNDTRVEVVNSDFFIVDTSLFANADVLETGLDFDLQIGFLEIKVESGTYAVHGETEAVFVDPGWPAPITLSELTSTPIINLTSVSSSGSLFGNMPVKVKDINSIGFNSTFDSLSLTIILLGNPFDPFVAPGGSEDPRTAPPIDMSLDFKSHLLPFTTIMADGVLGLLEQLKGWYGSFGTSSLFSVVDVPFADGETLASVLDFFSGLDDLLTSTFIALTNEEGITTPQFLSVQSLALALDNALGINMATINPAYDLTRHELTFTISLNPNLPTIVEIPIDFNLDLSPLGEILANVNVSIEPEISFLLTFGIDLRSETEIGIASNLVDNGLRALINKSSSVSYTPSSGQLINDAKFKLTLGGLGSVFVNVTQSSTSTNSDIYDLAYDIEQAINLALASEEIDDKIMVDVITGDRFSISSENSSFLKIQNNSQDDAETQGGFKLLGFWDGQVSSTSPTPLNGVLSDTAVFDITVGTKRTTIDVAQNTSNADEGDPTDKDKKIEKLILDIRTRINSLLNGSSIVDVRRIGDGIVMVLGSATDEKFLRIDNTNDIARNELGLPEDQIAAELTILGDRSLYILGDNLSYDIQNNFTISEDVSITLEIDGEEVTFTVRAANGNVIGFCCNQGATGTLTANEKLEEVGDPKPEVDITIRLTMGNESYRVSLPTSLTDDNSNIDDLVYDLNTAFQNVVASNGSTIDISSEITAGKDAGGEKLTLTPTNLSTFIRVSSMGTTQDNEDLLDLVDDVNEALARETLSDGTSLNRVVVAGLIVNDTNNDNVNDEFHLTLAIPSALKDWLNITSAPGDLGFSVIQAHVFGPGALGRLTDDATFTLTVDNGSGLESFDVGVNDSDTFFNQDIYDLVLDINEDLKAVTPSGGGSAVNLSGRVKAGILGNRITLSATNKSEKILKITDINSVAHYQMGFDDGVTAKKQERRGRLFIRNASVSAGLDLVVATPISPALSAHFGFVGIEAGTINGTLTGYSTDAAVHGGVSLSIGGIKSRYDLSSSNFDLNGSAIISLEFDNYPSVTATVPEADYDNITNMAAHLQFRINQALIGILVGPGNITVGISGSRLTISSAHGERLRISVQDGNAAEDQLGFATGQQTGSFYLADLADALTDIDILKVIVDLEISGEGNLTLSDIDISLGNVVIGLLQELGADPKIVITLSDFTDMSTLNVTALDMGAIADGFDDLNFSNILKMLRSIYNILANFSKYDFYDEPMPILGVTLNETLNFFEPYLSAIEELSSENASIVQELTTLLKQVLGLPTDGDSVILSLFKGSTILRFNITWDTNYSASLPVQIDLLDLLGISLPPSLQGLANLSGAAGLEAEFSVEVTVGMGIDLSNLTIYIYDNTEVRLEGYANASNVNFIASLGPFGLFVTGGHAVFNEDGDPNNTNPAFLILSAFDDPNPSTEGDRIDLFNLSAYNLKANLSAGIGAILPCYFPTASNFIGNLDFALNISLKVGTSDPFDIDVDAILNSAPDFTKLPDFGNFSLLDSLLLAVEGLDILLAILESVMSGEFGSISIPLVGDKLEDGAEFIEDIRGNVIPKLRDFIENAPTQAIGLIQQAIFNSLGPGGLDLLVLNKTWHDDGMGNSAPDYRDVQYSYPASGDELQFMLHLGGLYSWTSPEFDFGLPGFGLEMDGGLTIQFDWNFLLVFGISFEDGFYFDTTPLDEFTDQLNGAEVTPQSGGSDLEHMFEISLGIGLPNSLTGNLLFLQLDVDNMDYPGLSLEGFFAVDVEGGGSNGRLSFAQIPSMSLDFSYGVEADLDLDLTLGIIGGDYFPSIVSEFYLRWGLGDSIDNSSVDPLDNHYAIPYIKFQDVGLNLGSFFSDFLAPILEEIQRITKPIQPLVDILTSPIPVISDLAGEDITLIDIAGMFGVVDPSFIYAIADIITLINSIPTDAGDIIIPFGSFAIGGDGTIDLREEGVLDVVRNSPSGASLTDVLGSAFPGEFGDLLGEISSFLSDGFGDRLDGALGGSSASSATKAFSKSATKEEGGFSFPIFQDPGQVFGLLLGKPADLIVYDMPPLVFDFTYSQYFPIWDGLGAEISGSLGVIIDLSFGYDTYGIQQFAAGGFKHPLDLLKGFYIGDLDRTTGEDIPEIRLYGSLTGAAVLNIVVAKVGVGGGIYATVDFNLNDPDGDGKVRIEEILGNIKNGFEQLGIPLGLICIFDVSGRVEARLFAFIEALFGLWKKTWYFGPSLPLIEFSYSCPKPPILATETSGGELRLNMGEFAKDRLYGDITDGNEEFHVDLKSGNTVLVWAPKLGVSKSNAQEYSGVNKIIADSGEGNDIIDMKDLTTPSITAELVGGSGNDVLIAGAGPAILKGGLGDDVLIGGEGADELYGEKGNDYLIGNGGTDYLEGADGNDVMNGDAQTAVSGQPHTLRGSQAEDVILGGDGNDLLAGGAKQDVLRGGNGKDGIWGDSSIGFEIPTPYKYNVMPNGGGDPFLEPPEGTPGNDHITGDEDTDRIFGGGGNDLISGGGGPDELNGDAGNDKIWCDSSFKFVDNVLQMSSGDPVTIFPLYGTAAGDFVHGNDGEDLIYGEDGNDELYGDDDDDEIYGMRGADIIYGGNDEDDLYGGSGNDRMFGNEGNDLVKGDTDNDIMFGDDGEVHLVPDVVTFNLDLVRTINPGTTGDDTMDGNIGDDIILGGPGQDTINGGEGHDRLLGDNGELDFTYQGSMGGSLIDLVESTDLAVGDVDHIYGGEGDDLLIGGRGGDFIFGDSNAPGVDGEDIAIGDNGRVDYVPNPGEQKSYVTLIETTDTASGTGGDDEIDGSENADILLGGVGADDIIGGPDDDIIVGDSGKLDYDTGDGNLSTLDLILTTDNILPAPGGIDEISGGEANDIVLGGDEGDFIFGDDTLLGSPSSPTGEDILVGDQGEIVFINGILARIKTTDTVPGDGGADTIEGNEENDIILGGVAGDDLYGHTEDDIIIGDEGQLKFNLASGSGGDSDPQTLDLIETINSALGDSDTIYGDSGEDIILGGTAGDDIWGNTEDDLILGDSGKVIMPGEVIDMVMTTDPAVGGDDTIEGNEDKDIILGGAASDDIWGHADDDIILGDNGKITMPDEVIELIETTDPSIGGSDTIEGNAGADIIFGGAEGDDIWGNDARDIILGDNGKVIMPLAVIDYIQTTDPAIGGDDTIEGNSGDDIILGGAESDDIWGNTGYDIILGDNGNITMPDEVIDLIFTTDPAIGGNDTIEGNEDDDIILGGAYNDDIWGNEDEDMIMGDNGQIIMPDEVLEKIETTDPGIGGSDNIYGNDADDIILGGMDGDWLEGNADRDIILGDNGMLDWVLTSVDSSEPDPTTLDLIIATDPNDGGVDTIYGGTENDIAFGGTDGDTIYGNPGNDLLFGDHARVERKPFMLLNLSTLPVPTFIFIAIFTAASDGGDGDLIHGNEGDDILLGQQGDDLMFGDEDDDDLIGGHNVVGGIDELDVALGLNDIMDGGSEDDVLAGDNAVVLRRYDTISPRMRALAGTTLYDQNDNADVTSTHQANPSGARGRDITLLDHSHTPTPYTYGNDYMAGGSHEDVMFGQLGDDLMQGDSSVFEVVSATDPSIEGTDDMDDYMEGNGGKDLMFGNYGQDDILGGNSELFGLTTSQLRPDDADIIFGGAGTRIVRNDPGDTSAEGHAADSDYILGDNGNIFRVVGTNGVDSGSFLSFNYDNYGNITIIPRSVQLLDYTPGGDPSDIGTDDLIHGEASDDLIHGMVGNDVLFGEGQDDDMYGQSGHDRMYGGTGQDGMLGDDGRVRTSRNGQTEPLYALTVAFKERKIKMPGPFIGAWVDIKDRLKKVADIAAFEFGGNDRMYGGLGNDWMHGGAGDDGMSGAEALLAFYSQSPITNTTPLPYDPVTRKISFYDAENPRTKITGFFLNFAATDGMGNKIYDGKDRMFGDNGNDWLVGGTQNDRHFGGLGDDVINADDNHDSQGGLNNEPDVPEFADRDFTFGGAGLDVLIFNTGGDRSFDWIGEFNSYIAPYAPFGNPEVNRLISPHCVKFLMALGESAGADQLFVESDGELGLADQHDPRWGYQHGAPRDPQAGNLPGVHRDTMGEPEDDR
jgi:Ca2+-binding RTX toxin-like protein